MKKYFGLIIVGYIFILALNKANDFYAIITDTLNIWLFKVLPQIFTFYLLGIVIIETKAIKIISKVFSPLRKLLKFQTDFAFELFFLSFFLGNPSTTSFIVMNKDKKAITQTDANNLYKCSSFINPLFLFSLIDFYLCLIIYISHIIANIIICVIVTNKTDNTCSTIYNESLYSYNKINSLDSLNNVIKILFIIALYMVISNIIIYSLSYLNISRMILSYLELSTGVIYLVGLNNKLSHILLASLIPFNGLAIHMQVFAILNDKSSYMTFFIYRIYQSIITVILFVISYFICF